jgi:hypothetical protein
MAAIYSNKGAYNFGTGTVSIAVPSGYKQGDLLVLCITGRSYMPATPSGWTDIKIHTNPNIYLKVCYKISASTESSLTLADSGTFTAGVMLLFKGNAFVSPIGETNSNDSSSTAFSATGITTSKPRCLIVHVIGFYDSSTVADSDNYTGYINANLSGIAERYDYYVYSATNLNSGICVVTGNKLTAGYTGNTTATADSLTNIGAVVTFSIIEPDPTNFLQFFM